MDKYNVMLSPKALRDIDSIYEYIANTLVEPNTALQLVNEIETAIRSLSSLPNRGAVRKVGAYANQGYRQLLVKNYLIIYRVDEVKKEVLVVTVQHSRMK